MSSTANGVERRKEPPSSTRTFTLNQLAAYDGNNPASAILVGAKGKVYDVTDGADFYGWWFLAFHLTWHITVLVVRHEC